jgi:hypothetical protein
MERKNSNSLNDELYNESEIRLENELEKQRFLDYLIYKINDEGADFYAKIVEIGGLCDKVVLEV